MTGTTSTTENHSEDRSEIFVRFHRRNLIGVMVIALVLGAISLALALSPKGAGGIPVPAWMLPILIVGFSRLLMTVDGRRIDPQSPEVQAAIHDEWRRTNMLRAARLALIVVLLGQCPLALAFAFLLPTKLDPVRIVSAMAASTIVLGIVTTITLFLYFDRE